MTIFEDKLLTRTYCDEALGCGVPYVLSPRALAGWSNLSDKNCTTTYQDNLSAVGIYAWTYMYLGVITLILWHLTPGFYLGLGARGQNLVLFKTCMVYVQVLCIHRLTTTPESFDYPVLRKTQTTLTNEILKTGQSNETPKAIRQLIHRKQHFSLKHSKPHIQLKYYELSGTLNIPSNPVYGNCSNPTVHTCS